MKSRIAIVGAGISGLTCAYLLHEQHDVVVFESEAWIGGHTHTVDVSDADGRHAVDTGFIVFNRPCYPNFVRLLERLGVAKQESEMSFSVHDERSGIEWNGLDLRSIFVQKRNLLRPSFLGMLRDVVRFGRDAKALAGQAAGDASELPLGVFLERQRYGRAFRELYLLPMGAAIWSTSLRDMLDFPARFFVRFFANHGMLELNERPQWYVIQGGSRRYVEALIAPFQDRIRTATPVAAITRSGASVGVRTRDGDVEHFDRVILASHADQSLAMLEDKDALECEVLGALPFTVNRTTLHEGRELLPQRRRAVASWNYRIDAESYGDAARPIRLCYHMNTLQSLQTRKDYCVSLNSDDRLRAIEEARGERRVLGSWDYAHPRFTPAGVAAQARWGEIDGRRNTHFAGAYWRNGFHEDGVVSALRVCAKFGVAL